MLMLNAHATYDFQGRNEASSRKMTSVLIIGPFFPSKKGNTWVKSAFGNVFTILLQN